MNSAQAAKLIFHFDLDEQRLMEAQSRGCLSHVSVQLQDGKLYAVSFYDPVRLQQDLEEDMKLGHPYIADPGMIVVPEITLASMQKAVELLAASGYFWHFLPMRINQSGRYSEWPPPQLPPDESPGMGSS